MLAIGTACARQPVPADHGRDDTPPAYAVGDFIDDYAADTRCRQASGYSSRAAGITSCDGTPRSATKAGHFEGVTA